MTFTYPFDPANTARDRLRALMRRAKNATNHNESLRIAIFGDSTWTVPGGFGVFPMHHLVLRLGEIFGNTAGTQLLGVTTSLNTPYLNSSHNGAQADPWDATYEPPGLVFGGLPGPGEHAYAPNYTMDVDCQRFAGQRLQMAGYSGFPSTNVRLEVFAAKRDNSCPSIGVEFRPTNLAINLFEPQVGTTEIIPVQGIAQDVSIPSLIRVVSQAYTPPSDKPRPCWFLRSGTTTTVGSGSVAPMLLAGVRVLNANPVGAMVDSWSGGGYSTQTWIGPPATGVGGVKGNAIPVAAQLPTDVWVFTLGLNDFYNGITAATSRNNYYDPNGAVHAGMIGELIKAREALGLPVPVIVLVSPPFRANNGEGTYAARKAQHDLFANELRSLADELQADGYDAIMRDVKAETELRGFNSLINDFQGTNVVGAYNTSSVAYSVGDVYTGTNGIQYRCLVAHTSTADTEPTDDLGNFGPIYHRPIHLHLAGAVAAGPTADPVHWSQAGAELVSDSLANLFLEHSAPASTQLSDSAVAEIVAAIKADADLGTTGLIADAATAATELAKVPRAFAPVTAGGDFAWNKVEDTAGKLTINITPED